METVPRRCLTFRVASACVVARWRLLDLAAAGVGVDEAPAAGVGVDEAAGVAVDEAPAAFANRDERFEAAPVPTGGVGGLFTVVTRMGLVALAGVLFTAGI